MTRTYAILEVGSAAYQEIRDKLLKAEYQHVFHQQREHGEVIDMHGLALAEVQSGPVSTVSQQDILDTLARVTACLKTALDPESKLPKDALQSALNEGEALVDILKSQSFSAGQSSGEGPLDITPSAVQEVRIHLVEGVHDIAFEQNNPVTGLTTVFIRPKAVKSDDYEGDGGVITRSEARKGLNFMPIGGEFRDGTS